MIDVLTFTGNYPYRKIRVGINDIVRIIKPEGFTDIFVIKFESLFYKDFNEGNRELLNEYMESTWRKDDVEIYLLAGVNPFYISSVNDIKKFSENFKGLVIAPLFHGFNLSCNRVVSIIRVANDVGLPVLILGYLEDIREMHRAYKFRHSLSIEKIKDFFELIKKYNEKPRLALISFPFKILSELANDINKLTIYTDVSYEDVYGPIYDYVKILVENIGEDLIVFASKTPLTYIKCVLFKVLYSEIDEYKKEKILKQNAKKFFDLK